MVAPMSSARPHYGYDAPGIMLGFLLGGGALVAIGVTVIALTSGLWIYAGLGVALLGVLPAFLGLLMLVYAFFGKMRTRDHILHLSHLGGHESLLDVGTGSGLLLVGAAKNLPHGKAVGIDVWSAKDLSNNVATTTQQNAAMEAVSDRVEILTCDARGLAFPDASFDRVVSLLCLHNIDDRRDQNRVCQEIARVLKPGGRVVIGDYVPTHSYASAFADAGLAIVQSRSAFRIAWSLMWIMVAEKQSAPPGSFAD